MAYHSQMPVDSRDALVGVGFEQLGCDEFLDGQYDAVLAPDADRGATVLDRLHGVLDLEVAAIGGEDGVGEVVTCAYRRLRGCEVSFRGSSWMMRIAGRAATETDAKHTIVKVDVLKSECGRVLEVLRIQKARVRTWWWFGGGDGWGLVLVWSRRAVAA